MSTDLITRHYALINLSHETVLELHFGLDPTGAPFWDVSPSVEIVFSTAPDQVLLRSALDERYRALPGALPQSGEFSIVVT